MELGRVKELYGDKICLWGGVPVEYLVNGTPKDIKRAVKEAIEKGKAGGGYIFGTSHSIAVGTQYDNFMTMLDEFDRLR